jgi:hypothetical protein
MGFVKVREADAHVRQWSRSFGGEYVPIEEKQGMRHGMRHGRRRHVVRLL